MKIAYNVEHLPERKRGNRKESEEVTALKSFLADGRQRNMVFEYNDAKEAKKRYDSLRNFRNANKLQEVFDMYRADRFDYQDQEPPSEEGLREVPMYFRECPRCGAHLDPGEPCDCREVEKEAAPAATGPTSRKWTQTQSISPSAGSQGLEVMPCRTMN